MSRLPKSVQMAVIGAPHGTRGEVRVRSFTGDPAALGNYGPLACTDGRVLTVSAIRHGRGAMIVRFREIADRTAAETLSGQALHVDRSALPADLDEDEFYHADLVGLAVLDADGTELGTVAALHDFGAGDIVEIALASGGSAMVPFTRAAVPGVEIVSGCIVVDLVAAGLAEETGKGDARKADGDDVPSGEGP